MLEENTKTRYNMVNINNGASTMTNEFILTLVTLIAGISFGFTGFYVYKQKAQTLSSAFLKKELAFAPIYISSVIILSLLYFITPKEDDFIHDFSALELFVPLLLAGICYVLTLFTQTAKFINIFIIAAISISVYFLPPDFLMFKGYLPLWADRLAIILLWSVFSCFYYILNGVDGILPIFSASYLICLIILSLFDAAPAFYGLTGLALLCINGSFLAYNWFPAKITLSNNSCKIFGFMLGGIMTFAGSENLAPCFAIILTIFALELLQSIFKKLSLRNRYADLNTNTICYQAHISGLTPNQVCFAIFKVQILFIILGCFQAYLPNNYSLPIASLFLAAWFLNKLKNWDEPTQSLKEINQEFVSDLRQNINDIKNSLNRD